jgi:hypothetical protein
MKISAESRGMALRLVLILIAMALIVVFVPALLRR